MTEELRLRIISAIVLASVVLAATWFGGLVFRLLAVLIGLLIFYEWAGLTQIVRDRFSLFFGWVAMVLISFEVVFRSMITALVLLAGFVLVAIAVNLVRRKGLWLAGGILYGGLGALSLSALRGSDSEGLVTILFLFAIVWATDIFAYFIGRAIGGPKLAPRISPGKTWSGAIGGTFCSIIAGLGVIFSAGEPLSLWHLPIILGLSVASQIGDLFESWVKRKFGAKDSSHLIPGHGGVMDRVDGLIFASSAAFVAGILLLLAQQAFVTGTGHIVTGV